MKTPCALFALFFCHILSGQNKKPTDNILFAGKFEMTPGKNQSNLAGKLPVKDIRVWDYRFDSSKIGYVENPGFASPYSKIVLNSAWDLLLNQYFANNLDKNSGYSLLLVIRDYWMQDGTYTEVRGDKAKGKFTSDDYDIGGTTVCGIDVFIQTDSLTPFFQVNHHFIWGEKYISKNVITALYFPFDSIAKRIITADISAIVKKRNKTPADAMASYYKQKREMPILHQTNWQKGIYYSFEDFKTNKLFATDLRLQIDKYTDELYIVNNKEHDLVIDYWGYSDGKDLFIKSGFNVYRAVRQLNSFEVFGAKQLRASAGSGTFSTTYGDFTTRSSSLRFKNKILQVNMESGRFY